MSNQPTHASSNNGTAGGVVIQAGDLHGGLRVGEGPPSLRGDPFVAVSRETCDSAAQLLRHLAAVDAGTAETALNVARVLERAVVR
ncbi:hypothetical protein [Streptomyces cacaoi]|uniref:Uncharacterized protein n=1 Tax=Streptomyces cacaoi TaxID=1898 RepID=A0A4Y3QYX9_STRCI|nr:hypothetical protein [Streptomyces cacaoi]GEB50392.1 hypothetical protein SCA03_29430 [Streptomyces cacaoi]